MFITSVDIITRRSKLYSTGFSLLMIFISLDFINSYVDASHWLTQRSHLFTLLSFINVSKCPPSMDYISVTIGVALIVLGLLDRVSRYSFSFDRVIGSVPFFFYIIHIILYRP